jgi:hypothetical protein
MHDSVCPHCGETYHDRLHIFLCDGRQGHVEAEWEARTNVRTTDPDTSHAAAERVGKGPLTRNQERIRLILTVRPMTHEEILAEYIRRYGPTAESTPRKRCCDLKRMGLVEDSGERRLLKSGHKGIVWQLVKQ